MIDIKHNATNIVMRKGNCGHLKFPKFVDDFLVGFESKNNSINELINNC